MQNCYFLYKAPFPTFALVSFLWCCLLVRTAHGDVYRQGWGCLRYDSHSEGSYCFKNCSHVYKMQGKHVAPANLPYLSPACLVAAEGGCELRHFLCSWEEGGVLCFPWLCQTLCRVGSCCLCGSPGGSLMGSVLVSLGFTRAGIWE